MINKNTIQAFNFNILFFCCFMDELNNIIELRKQIKFNKCVVIVIRMKNFHKLRTYASQLNKTLLE